MAKKAIKLVAAMATRAVCGMATLSVLASTALLEYLIFDCSIRVYRSFAVTGCSKHLGGPVSCCTLLQICHLGIPLAVIFP